MAIYNSAMDDRVTWTTGVFFDEISDTVKTRFDDNQGYRSAAVSLGCLFLERCLIAMRFYTWA